MTVERFVHRAIQTAWTRVETRAAGAYVAGKGLHEAVQICRRLEAARLGSIVCLWNTPHQTPRGVADECCTAAATIARESLDCYVSLKPHALGFSRDLVAEILERARGSGVRLHVDAQKWDLADPTLALVSGVSNAGPALGFTLPGRWRRSREDARTAIDLGLRVRVVKGQNPDPAAPDADLRLGFLDVVNDLAGRAVHVAVATHDVPLARRALERLLRTSTPCELELLFGLPLAAPLQLAAELGVRARVYVPYGDAAVPYHYSDLRRNPRMLSWLAQDLFTKPRPPSLPI